MAGDVEDDAGAGRDELVAVGAGGPGLERTLLPFADGTLCPLLPLWLLLVRWRELCDELTEDVEPDASGRAYGGFGAPPERHSAGSVVCDPCRAGRRYG